MLALVLVLVALLTNAHAELKISLAGMDKQLENGQVCVKRWLGDGQVPSDHLAVSPASSCFPEFHIKVHVSMYYMQQSIVILQVVKSSLVHDVFLRVCTKGLHV